MPRSPFNLFDACPDVRFHVNVVNLKHARRFSQNSYGLDELFSIRNIRERLVENGFGPFYLIATAHSAACGDPGPSYPRNPIGKNV